MNEDREHHGEFCQPLKDSERLTPNELADLCEGTISRLTAERKAAKSDSDRKALSARIKSARILLLFARTRAGYVPKGKRPNRSDD